MNPMLIAAICGFLFRELQAIAKRNDRSVGFDLKYYLTHNWIALALNVVGTVGLYVAIHDILDLEQRYLGGQWPVLTGGGIGYGGAALVRWLQGLVKKKVNRASGMDESSDAGN